MNSTVSPKKLIEFAAQALIAAGLEPQKASLVAETLVEGDLLGHHTHGLQLLPSYLSDLEAGMMLNAGEPDLVNENISAFTWDGRYLPGPWLLHTAIDMALERSNHHPVVTAVIRRSHHIACLAAYLKKVTDKGRMIILSCSDPANKTVAPFGATKAVYSPNPVAVGIPTESDPILIDISLSVTSNARVKAAKENGELLPEPWLLDENGTATNDPNTFFSSPASTILPLGGLDTGYKGFALGLMVEALTNALGGYGRADDPNRWTASVFIQIINPAFFAGEGVYRNEMEYLKTVSEGAGENVRIPGKKALENRRRCFEKGTILSNKLMAVISHVSEKYSINPPFS